MRTLLSLLTKAIFVSCFCLMLSAIDAKAATWTVTKTADTNDGLCNSDCSLREAIAAASPLGTDEIVFSSLFNSPQIISLEDADGFRDLVITKSLSITGKGAHLLTIKRSMPPATTKYRIFTISGAITVNFSGLTIANGDVNGDGGGISVFGSNVNLTNCAVRNSVATGLGGGIRVMSNGSLTVVNSTISGNASLHVDHASGGGIHSVDSTLTVINSTVSGNAKNNSTGDNAGGIYTQNGTATISGSTITDNQAHMVFSAGSGITINGTTTTISNTIIAGNRNNTSVPDVLINSGSVTSNGYNLIGNAGSATVFNQPGDQRGNGAMPLNPLLDALGDYGGTTQTHRLQTNSPARDKGKRYDLTTDQRGLNRTIDDVAYTNASGGDGTDIGSYEEQTSTHLIVTKTADTKDGVCDADCSLREAIAAAGVENTIEFSSLFDTPQVITLSEAAGFRELLINKNLTITGKGANLLTIRRDAAATIGFSVFVISEANVTLTGATVSGGRGGSASTGGAFYNSITSTLTINRCNITGNSAIGASDVGGGISSHGKLYINNSTISNNTVTTNSPGKGGGGIYTDGAETIITNSTISGNTVVGAGDANAGGILNAGFTTIRNSTVTDNGANGANSAGGIYDYNSVTIGSTIVAGNRNNSSQPDVAGTTFTSEGFNLIGNVGSASGFDQPTDQKGNSSTPINPLLKPLVNNGGTTPTHALSAGSPAIDKGYRFGTNSDQRGNPRPFDNTAIIQPAGGDSSDVGAFEASFFPQIVVTKIEDTNDGVCDSDCSLREAIATAASGDRIIFASPLFDTPRVITLSEAAGFRGLVIDKSILLTGNGANLLTIRRNPAAAIAFSVFTIAEGMNLQLTGVTVSGGRSNSGGGFVTVNNSTLKLIACNITGNSAIGVENLGGGIYSRGNLYIDGSTISNNAVTTGASGISGGSIFIFSNAGETIITNSTISGNTVTGSGDFNAGGIYNNGNLTIRNSTVTDNGANGANSASGIYNNSIANIGNTIAAGNRSNSVQPDLLAEIGQPFTSLGFNLIGSATPGNGFTNGMNNDQVGTKSSPLNPALDALSMFGGTTPTHRLQSNSPAIDKGSSLGFSRDQRGATRPVDISNIPNGAGNASDIGAYELQTVASNQPPVARPDSYTTSRNATLTVITAEGVLANDTDVDNNGLLAIKVADPSHGTLNLQNTGGFVYTPNAGFFGTDTFTYKANDGALDSNVVTVSITVTNNPPTATDDSYSTIRNTPLTINAPGVLANDTDVNNDSLTAIQISNPSHGTATMNTNGGFTYTPTPNYSGVDSFTYKVNDGAVDSNVATVTLNVNAGSPVTLTVTRTADTNDGACESDCSLREAIAAAVSGDTIVFSSPSFNSPQVITLSEADGFQSLIINKNLTITGKGANLLTVRRSPSATAAFRIFEIGTGFNVSVNGMTITGGLTSGGGGGIHNKGTLALTACAIKGNSATDIGGGIYNAPDTTLTVNNSSISNNNAPSGGGIGGVGAITINTTAISNNNALTGGGIIAYDGTNLTITSSTISNNSAENTGGGIYRQGSSGVGSLRNTIVADNTAPTGPNLYGAFTSQGFNLVGNGSGATITPTTGDQIGTNVSPIDPKLGPLQNNGGTTETRALFAGSPAIDKGNSFGSTTDQRGSTRPVDLIDATYPNASGGNGSDIGAYEAQTLPSGGSVPSYVVTKTADTNDGACDADCSLREAIITANTNAGADVITFDIVGAGPHMIQLTSALPELSQSVKILNNSNESVTVRGEGAANQYGIFKINANQIVEISSLIITNGYSGGAGGGINNNGTLTLLNSTVRNNVASIFGGGIFSDVNSALTVINSTINGNTVNNGTGGGIATDGATIITNTSISNNSASQGGGVIVFGNANLTVTSSTISNNSAQSSGGGLFKQSGVVNLRNTIVADNAAPTGSDLIGTFNSQGFNLIENVSGATINETQNTGTNITGQDPKLGALQNNGGATETRALLTGSPAIDKGSRFGSTTDQRGLTRPFDVAQIPNAPGGDGSDIGAFEVLINNSSPIAADDSYSTGKNITLVINAPGVLSNDMDADNDILMAIKLSNPSHGTVTLNANGSFTYTPTMNYTGAVSFTYKANDGTADSGTVTVTIDIRNNPPTAMEDSYSTTRNTPLTVNAPGVLSNDTDANGDTLSAIKVADPSHGTVTLNTNGSFIYTPTTNYVGADSFTYRVSDGTASSGIVTVTLTVTNNAPTAVGDSYSTAKNTPLTINAPGVLSNDTDANGDALSAIKVSDPLHGAVTFNANGSFTYTPTANYTGTDSFTYKATDGVADSNVVTVTLTININTTLMVTKVEDTNDGVCDADCSLREAIASSVSGGTIVFSSLFNTPQVISLLGSETANGLQELVINKSLTINGKGANLLYIQRNDFTADKFRIFNITGNGVTVNLNNLAVVNGNSETDGSGINVNEGAALNITGCYIASNVTNATGGGIYVAGNSVLNLTNSTVFGNAAYGTASNGAGIHNEGILMVTNSTITANSKLHDSDSGGGGIWTNNTTTIINSTITDNQYQVPGSAGGIFRSGNNGTVTLRNTIVAGNINNSTYPDVVGAFVSEGYNLIGNVGNATGFNQTGDQTGTSSSVLNPRLAPLDFYGGRTPTYALFSNSSAVNAADPNNVLATDQRGVARPLGGRADIGAYELNFTFSNSPTGGGGQGTLPNGAIGQPYSVTFSVNSLSRLSESDSKRKQSTEGFPPASYTYTLLAGNLPDGLTLNPNTGQISGTPTQAGTFTFTLKVTDNTSGMSGAQAYVLIIGAPTAAGVTVSGRVLTLDGRGLTNARVVITDSTGNSRTTITSSLGYYRFDDVDAGQMYVISVVSKRYEFQQQVVMVVEELENLNFTALSSGRR